MRRPATNKADNALIAGAFLVFIMVIALDGAMRKAEFAKNRRRKARNGGRPSRIPASRRPSFIPALANRTVEDHKKGGPGVEFLGDLVRALRSRDARLDALQKDRGAANPPFCPSASTVAAPGRSILFTPGQSDEPARVGRQRAKDGAKNRRPQPADHGACQPGRDGDRSILGDAAWDAPEMIAFWKVASTNPRNKGTSMIATENHDRRVADWKRRGTEGQPPRKAIAAITTTARLAKSGWAPDGFDNTAKGGSRPLPVTAMPGRTESGRLGKTTDIERQATRQRFRPRHCWRFP